MPSIESTIVPVAVYRGAPVKIRYLWSGGDIDTINNAVVVGKLETGKTLREIWNRKSLFCKT